MNKIKDIKWDIKKGYATYRSVYTPLLRNWIINGRIKEGEVLVWRSGLSGWRKPEELDELKSFFQAYKDKDKDKDKETIYITKPKRKKIEDILIIDDEDDICWLLSKELKNKGYNVFIAYSGKEGISCFKKEEQDLVILDLKLPDISGEEVLEKIKDISDKSIVIMISAYGTPEVKKELKRKGAFCFIDKPFYTHKILSVIKSLISK